MSDADRSSGETLLAFTWLRHLPVALEGDVIEEIGASGVDGSLVDLFDVVGLPRPEQSVERRVARISGDAPRWLRLGERLELESVRRCSLLPLPSFLQGLTGQAGLVGFVSHAGTIFSVLDPTWVVNLASRGGGRSER